MTEISAKYGKLTKCKWCGLGTTNPDTCDSCWDLQTRISANPDLAIRMLANTKIFRLASEMLRLASDKFSNHGCNDLSPEITALISDDLCKKIRAWFGDDPWPESPNHIGDSSLMAYLSDVLAGK